MESQPVNLARIDWVIIVGYCVAAVGVGVWFSRRASRNLSEFFLSGRSLPWWIAGTSIVATTFACDTPLAITGIVRKHGLVGNWYWWCVGIGGMLSVFLYSRFWRRTGVLTDAELIERRYSGRSAAALRAFKAVYGGVIYNCVVMGWVFVAMLAIVKVVLGWKASIALPVLIGIALVYAVLSGFWGVVATDLIQFIMAMIGSVALAVFAVCHSDIGGLTGLVEKLRASGRPEVLNVLPGGGFAAIVSGIGVYLAILWWSKLYADGGGYVAQRLLACKNERHSAGAALWFNVAHYGLRTWPWVLVALASLILVPLGPEGAAEGQGAKEAVYARMMKDLLPPGLLGLMVASLVAAFMSTIDTHLNWGASYLVNDLYRRFFVTDASERHYVWVSRGLMVLLMAGGALVGLTFNSVFGLWKVVALLGAGIGLVELLRWFWWRINAWSEITGMAAALLLSVAFWVLKQRGITQIGGVELGFAVKIGTIVVVSIIAWVTVTLLTRPTSPERLHAFVDRVRPPATFWRPIARQFEGYRSQISIAHGLGQWVLGVAFVYLFTFGLGKVLLGEPTLGLCMLGVSVPCAVAVLVFVSRSGARRPPAAPEASLSPPPSAPAAPAPAED